MQRIVVIVVLATLAVAAWLSVRQATTRRVVVSGFVEADQVRVGSRVGGRVSVVHVEEGFHVAAGDRLFEIAPFDLKERLTEAKALLASASADYRRLQAGLRAEEVERARARWDQARATLAKLEAGPRPEEISIARERRRMADANLELAESEFQRVEKLRQGASAAKTEFDQAVRALKHARAEVAAAREEVTLLEKGSRDEDIRSARAKLAESKAALAEAQSGFRPEEIERAGAQEAAASAHVAAMERQLSELVVVSPCDCLVETIDLRPGDLVAANAPSVSLLEAGKVWVRTYLPQIHLGRVRVGDLLPVTVDTLAGTTFDGRVAFIASEGEFTPRNLQTPEERGKQVFRMKLVLEGDTRRLRVGMAVDVLLPQEPAS